MIMLHARQTLAQLKVPRPRQFCTNATKPTKSSSSSKGDSNITQYKEAYQQLDKLDFMTASKILFTDPPKKKKFGIDFHLVQLFFACMPSLAVYLVAQYARHEMRKMDAELEEKRKKEEEKAKEMELKAMEKKDPELVDVKVRLDKLEEAVKEIVVESKKQSDASVTKIHKGQSDDKHLATAKLGNIIGGSESNKSMEKGSLSKQENAVQVTGGVGQATEPSSVTDSSQQERRSTTQQSGSSQDDNR